MIHKEFWGILFLVFVAWIFVPGDANQRITNGCRPIGWLGNVVVSVSSLAIPSSQETVQRGFDRFEYGCRFTAWRLLYQDEYNRSLSASTEAAASAASAAPTAKPKAVPPPQKDASK